MQKTTIKRLAKFSVYGALGLSLTIGIMPNIAPLGSGDVILILSGLAAIFSIVVVEAAVVVCGFTVLNAMEVRRFALSAILASVFLPVALLWSGYNIKRGLDMAPHAMAEQRENLIARAEDQEAQAAALRASALAMAESGSTARLDAIDRSARAADRVALESRQQAALISTPHPWMLGVLAVVIKLIELWLMYIATGRQGEQPRREAKPKDKEAKTEPVKAQEKPKLVVDNAPEKSDAVKDFEAWLRA